MALPAAFTNMNNNFDVEIIKIDDFEILHILSNPNRIEGKVILKRDDISQKLIFTLMELTHAHGFGCSPPIFQGPDRPEMIFLVGTDLPTKRSLNKYKGKMHECLLDINSFIESFRKQVNFDIVDLSMFSNIDMKKYYSEQMAATRDQYFNGSWEQYYDSLVDGNKLEEAEMVEKCVKFEEANEKDIGFVGYKLDNMLRMLSEMKSEKN